MNSSSSWITVFLASLAFITGCGGGGDAANAPTKTVFVKQANLICSHWQQERSAIFSNFNTQFAGQKVSKADKEKGVLELLKPYEEATQKLSQMTPPNGDEEKLEAIVAAMEAGAKEVQAHPLTVLSSNSTFQNANGLSTAFGLKECTF
jgi:hypothetical protein